MTTSQHANQVAAIIARATAMSERGPLPTPKSFTLTSPYATGTAMDTFPHQARAYGRSAPQQWSTSTLAYVIGS